MKNAYEICEAPVKEEFHNLVLRLLVNHGGKINFLETSIARDTILHHALTYHMFDIALMILKNACINRQLHELLKLGNEGGISSKTPVNIFWEAGLGLCNARSRIFKTCIEGGHEISKFIQSWVQAGKPIDGSTSPKIEFLCQLLDWVNLATIYFRDYHCILTHNLFRQIHPTVINFAKEYEKELRTAITPKSPTATGAKTVVSVSSSTSTLTVSAALASAEVKAQAPAPEQTQSQAAAVVTVPAPVSSISISSTAPQVDDAGNFYGLFDFKRRIVKAADAEAWVREQFTDDSEVSQAASLRS